MYSVFKLCHTDQERLNFNACVFTLNLKFKFSLKKTRAFSRNVCKFLSEIKLVYREPFIVCIATLSPERWQQIHSRILRPGILHAEQF